MLHVSDTSKEVILSIRDLKVKFYTEEGEVTVISDVNLDLFKGETVALIGESGSGKSILGHTIIRLLPKNANVSGHIIYKGIDLLKIDSSLLRNIRGREIAWIPQMVGSSLNPTVKIGVQIGEVLIDHYNYRNQRAWSSAIDLLKLFEVEPAEEVAKGYPHQLSGGMKQRVLIASAIAARPNLLIADEPTKGLDTIKKTLIVNIFKKIKDLKPDLSILLITHDLKFARELADRVVVMYCGKVIEINDNNSFFELPLHPYSKLLLKSLPSKGLYPIPGKPANVANPPSGCRFHPRCPYASDICEKSSPPLIKLDLNRCVACWLYKR